MSTQKTIELSDLPKFVPPLVGGDGEFKGHGPKVKVSARLSVRNGDELWVHLTMHAKETKKDYTEVKGSADYAVWRTNKSILRIVSDTYSAASYRDTDHADDTLTLSEGELIREFVCVGDTKGSEGGSRTGVSASFNPVTIELAD